MREDERERSRTYSLVPSQLGGGGKSCPLSHQEFVTGGAAGPRCDLKAEEEALRLLVGGVAHRWRFSAASPTLRGGGGGAAEREGGKTNQDQYSRAKVQSSCCALLASR